MDLVEPSTSSAAPAQPPAAEAAPREEPPSGLNIENLPSRPREDRMEGDSEQGIEEVPKKSSGLRFRKKSKQPKKQSSKGEWLDHVWTEMVDL